MRNDQATASLQGVSTTVTEAVTDEMIEVGTRAYNNWRRTTYSCPIVEAIYTAMRAVAPTAPVQDDDAERLRGALLFWNSAAEAWMQENTYPDWMQEAFDYAQTALAARGDQSPDASGGE